MTLKITLRGADKEYITTREAADLTGYTASYVRYVCKMGYVPYIVLGPRAWLVDKEALLNYRPRPVGRPKAVR